MNKNKVGILLLVVGIVLLVMGFNEYGAFGAKVVRTLGGATSGRTLLLFTTGGVCAGIGLLQMFKK